MDRRTVLAAATAALAGCTAGGDGGGSTDTSTPTPTVTTRLPSIIDRSFTGTPDCPEGVPAGSASVAADVATVSVAGCIEGRNGCAEARLESVDYDATGDTLRVAVAAVVDVPPDTMCTQAITPRGYEVVVTFAGGLPGRVAVVHDDVDGRREVATATPGR
jgi:hypothetical protein